MTKVKKPALEEKDTLKAVGEGDREAMTEIDHRYREPIIHYVLKRQRNKLGREDRPTAEDIVQDTMLAIWKNASNYRGESRVSTYIFGIVEKMIKKEALKHVRRKRELNHMKRIASSNLFSSPVERAALSSLYNKDLKAAVQVLDNKHHDEYEALKKRIVEEKTNAEIAEETTTNPITVRTRIHKALRKHLRGELAEKWSKKHVDELAWGLIYAEDAFENEENGRSSHEDT